jgi:acyl-CoA hydrolase
MEYLAGYATIAALDQLVGLHSQLRLENLQRQVFGQIEVYLSHLSLVTDDGIETLLGVSVVRDDELTAAARAVLDAVNRRLQRLLVGSAAAH